MAENCKDCQGQSSYVTYNVPKDCDKLPIKNCVPVDASCVFYTSSPLSVLGISTPNPSAEYIFQKIDEFLNNIVGANYGSYNTFCLGAVSTEQEFVETISQFVCQLREDVDNIDVSASDIITITNTINSIINPNLTLCSYIGTTSSSTLNEILVAISTRVCELNTFVSLSDVVWDTAYSVITTPTDISDGFTEVFRQIALLKASVPTSVSLPTFNTVLSCLPTKTATTPLSTVVNELVQRVCSTTSFSPETLSWGCVSTPTTSDLTSVVQSILTEISGLKSGIPLFDSDHFEVTSSSCDGVSVSLKDELLTSISEVSVTSDSEPGYLSEVLEAGNNISFDTTDPDKIRINSLETGRLKVSANGVLKYLNNAIQGGSTDGLAITVQESGDAMVVIPNVDYDIFVDQMLTTISNNPTLLAKLCNIICQCNNCN